MFASVVILLCADAAAWQSTPLLAAEPPSAKLQRLDHDPLSPFTTEESRGFFAALAKADTITDSLQRCLDFPDPPGSHWSRESVKAYSHYRLQETIGFAELKQLVTSGHASDVDRRFAAWSKDPVNHPEFFWHFLNVNFFQPRPDARDVIEAWKQQVPDSAFAHAASGFSFIRTAWRVRGGKFSANTPEERFDAMDSWLARADGDLRQAIKLDPHLGAAYASLMDIGTLQSDRVLQQAAATEGLRADPASFPVFDALALASAPKWCGSREAQSHVMAAVDRQTDKKPLLAIVRTSIVVEQTDVDYCDCTTPEERAAYRKAFDQVGTGSELVVAGKNALKNGQNELAAIYLAEALRFDPNDALTRANLKKALAGVNADVLPP